MSDDELMCELRLCRSGADAVSWCQRRIKHHCLSAAAASVTRWLNDARQCQCHHSFIWVHRSLSCLRCLFVLTLQPSAHNSFDSLSNQQCFVQCCVMTTGACFSIMWYCTEERDLNKQISINKQALNITALLRQMSWNDRFLDLFRHTNHRYRC